MDQDLRPRVLLAGSVVAVVLGALLPWATVNAGIFSQSVAGTEGDGVITLIMGLVVGGLVLAKWKVGLPKGFSITAIVLGALIFLIGVIDAADISSVVGGDDELFQISASVGIGLWLTILGGAAMVAGGIWELKTTPAPSPQQWGAPAPGGSSPAGWYPPPPPGTPGWQPPPPGTAPPPTSPGPPPPPPAAGPSPPE